jgi:prolyl-tRNA synthetase
MPVHLASHFFDLKETVNTFMRWSNFFIPTLREVPADAEVVSHRLLLRAGMVRQLAAGIYSYLPLSWLVMRRIMRIVREEMDAVGGQEFFLPALNPREIWEESGRWAVMGDTMFRLKDRKGADLCLGITNCAPTSNCRKSGIRYRRNSATKRAPSPACCASASSS